MEWSDALMPAVSMLRTYPRGWLRHDVVAGLVMTTMLVPVGIAYAEASGLPGINGLLQAAGIGLYFAEVKEPVKDKLKRFGLFAHFGEQSFCATIEEAVSAYVATHSALWSEARVP